MLPQVLLVARSQENEELVNEVHELFDGVAPLAFLDL